MRLFELFDSNYELGPIKTHGLGSELTFKDSADREIEVSMLQFEPYSSKIYGLAFTRNGSAQVTGDGEEFKIFSTVLSACRRLIEIDRPNVLFFAAELAHGSRANLYRRMINKFAPELGFTIISQTNLSPELQEIVDLYDDSEELFVLVSKNYLDNI